MSYGHAERNLALIRQLEAEPRQLLGRLIQPDAEQSAWLQTARLAPPPPRMPAEDGWAPADHDEMTAMRHVPLSGLDVSRLASWNGTGHLALPPGSQSQVYESRRDQSQVLPRLRGGTCVNT
jgi:hypothetical protein